ncbi:MAG: MT-A70 family methyltransferase, partial [Candidatus Aminicenantes bacterium]|nr:MT-A70 family methyltransferase [Candidatus Aminicenantes bacterium]
NNNFERAKIYGEKILQGLAESLNVSKRTLYYAVEFARKYPRLDTVPEGKNITWNKIITKYLPARKENNVVINPPEGLYNIIVIDPPWPIEKIQRDCRPNQIEVDYPIMTLEEIQAVPLPAANDCHVWLWTTHRFLPDALKIAGCPKNPGGMVCELRLHVRLAQAGRISGHGIATI